MSTCDPDLPRRAQPPPAWEFDHPPHGTCVPSCSSFGRCHCGCGQPPKISHATVEEQCRFKGRPFTFVSGHQARVKHPRAGIWSRNGVPIETIRPMLFWLRERHGTMRTVAELLAMPEATVRGYVYNRKRKRVPPRTARKIANLVLAHRARGGPLDRWEEEPGLRQDASVRMRRLRSGT
jgi:hypothetical protein